MNIERWFYGNFLYGIYHRLKRDQVMQRIDEYEKNQWLTREKLLEIQETKLRMLLEHAARSVPYYRSLLAPVSKQGDAFGNLSRLPPLTKTVIREAGPTLLAEDSGPEQLEANSTSGSTGEPLYFFTDHRSSDCRKAIVVRNRRWAGIELGDREARLWGSPIDNNQARKLRGRIHSWLTRTKMLSAYELSRDQLQRYIRELLSYRPRLLIAYPSVLEQLAFEAQRSSAEFTSLRAIIVSAETLFDHQRSLFHKIFGVPIFNRYGCREVGDIAHECEAHEHMHINVDRIFVEIVREDLSPCGPGEVGNVLLTDLDNYGMPLIRYAVGDRATFAPEGRCGCGRELPSLAVMEGRSLDVIRFPNGSGVGGTYWTILLRQQPGISQFQVVQREPAEVIVYYVADREIEAQFRDAISADVRRRAGDNFEVIFERVKSISMGAGGKRRLVVNEMMARQQTVR